ncbi:AT-rich interactive domain-containing protein 1-like isoform X2 [Cornus florida]|nr:AT-rich interactive domain-containing protein 1-like isoform X2 [Cornus florida]
MLGDGQSVDLFKLFLAVRENGGYETVSKNGLWDSVAEKSGFSTGVASAVKLIYIKYLDSLDRWLKRIVESKDSKSELPGSGVDLSGFLMGLESEFSGQKKKDGEYPHLDLEKSELKDGVYPHLDLEKSELKDGEYPHLDFTDVEKPCSADGFGSFVESNGGKESIKENKDDMILDSRVVEEEISNKKRKRDCDWGMLNWVIEVAKNPCDPQFGSLPERSKWRSYGSKQLWKQVLLAREAMFLKRHVVQCTEHKVYVTNPHSDLEKSELDQKKKDGEYPHLDLEKSESDFTDVGKPCIADEFQSSVELNEGKEIIKENKDNIILDSCVIEEEIPNRKRKRDCDWGMLDWVIKVAKNPCGSQFESLPDRSKWRSYGNEQLWKQVLLAREAMFLKRQADQSTEHWQKNQKMHPSMYDDYTGSERSRCSQRLLSVKEYQALLSLKKPRARACSESSSGTLSDLEDNLEKQSDPIVSLYIDNHKRKRIPVGPFFQAKVPEWTGETYESDSKWLGTQVWPVKGGENKKYLIERDRIGKGRQDSCGCQLRGSIECVRFHVVEKRMRVKLELDSAFHSWKFNKMGEEVALSWTKEEELKFQAIVRSNPPSMEKCFWDEIFKSFRGKSREDLVSYYFNVFLLQRRAQQNRSTPSHIDSDDDESELGSMTNGFGREAAKSPGSILRTPKKPHLNFR